MNDLQLLKGGEIGSLVSNVPAQVSKWVKGQDQASQSLISKLDNSEEGDGVLRRRSDEQLVQLKDQVGWTVMLLQRHQS